MLKLRGDIAVDWTVICVMWMGMVRTQENHEDSQRATRNPVASEGEERGSASNTGAFPFSQSTHLLKVNVKSLSRVWLFETPWTVAYQAPHPWDFPGKSTGVGHQCLLRRIDYHSLIYIPWNISLGNSYFPMIPWTVQEATSPYRRFTKHRNWENCYIKEICQIPLYLALSKIIWPEELSILLLFYFLNINLFI